MQEVQLDSKVKLLDSPGMVLASGNMTDASVALRNAVRVDALDDPVTPVQAILQRYKRQFCLNINVTKHCSPVLMNSQLSYLVTVLVLLYLGLEQYLLTFEAVSLFFELCFCLSRFILIQSKA